MRILLQVVQKAECLIDKKIHSSIGRGFLFFVGYNYFDKEETLLKTIKKACSLRLFADSEGKMNLSLDDIKGEIMCISQFTLYADIKKGRRPSFVNAAREEISRPLYERTLAIIKDLGYSVQDGVFGADMKINLINDGPNTIIIDSEDL